MTFEICATTKFANIKKKNLRQNVTIFAPAIKTSRQKNVISAKVNNFRLALR
jgi:hypothetical protein